MSLINQILKDLDKRRGPVSGSHIAALQGMGLVNINRFKWIDSLSFTAWGVAGLLAIVASYQASIWWNSRSESEPAITPQTAAEAAGPEQNAQLETLPAKNNINAAPLAAITNQPESMKKPLDKPVAPPAEPLQAALETPAETIIRPVNILTPAQKADHLFASAQQALSRHQQQRGESLLRQALDEYSRHVSARSQLAALHVSRQQEDKAERLLAEGLVTDSNQLALARPYAQLLSARDELVPALEALDRAIGQRQADAETLALRAAILYRIGRHTESVSDYRQALQVQPNQALWWTGLAVALEQSSRSAQALEAYQRAAKLPLDKPVDDYVKQRIQVLRDTEFHH